MSKQKTVQLSKPADKALRSLDPLAIGLIQDALVALSVNPFLGKPLQKPWKGFRSYRLGDYRIIYQFDETTLVVARAGHRKDVYR